MHMPLFKTVVMTQFIPTKVLATAILGVYGRPRIGFRHRISPLRHFRRASHDAERDNEARESREAGVSPIRVRPLFQRVVIEKAPALFRPR